MNSTPFTALLADAQLEGRPIQVWSRSGREYAGVVTAVAAEVVQIEMGSVTHYVALDAIEAITETAPAD